MNRLAMACLVLGGCSWAPETIDTSGSHPTFGTTAPMTAEAKEAEVDTGRLLVFSPSGYTVYTPNGHKVAHEDNNGARPEGPAERKLAPGRYFVRLDEPSPQRDFWVTVERARVTRVENRPPSETPPAVK